MDKKSFWEQILTKLFSSANKQHILTFFNNSIIVGVSDGVLTLGFPVIFSKEFIRERYHLKLLQLAQEGDASIRDVQYEIVPALADQDHPDKIDMTKFKDAMGESPSVRKVPNKMEVIVDGTMRSKMMKYHLNNFMPGSNNRLVHAACTAVAAKPGDIYNPLYLYGQVGLGKTHLLQATGNEILRNHPNKRVIYMTAEKFINEIIDAIGKRHTKPFKDNYRNVDCLIVDDIQFFANKATSEQEFFHTFNELYDAGKQIIMSADRPPRDLDGLDDRLRSRFAMGMVIEVCLPDFETRVAILQRKAQEYGEMIAPEILEFIAYNVTSSVREMIGILINAIALAKLEQTNPTIRSVADAIKKLNKVDNLVGYNMDDINKRAVRTLDDIIDLVAGYYKIPRSDLIGEQRCKEIMFPRQICMYLIREILDQSYEAIGENFGGRNHTTILHSCNKIVAQMKVDERLVRDVNALKREMGV
ncbi:MAG: chromosomal replication initiator protein DnaA [Candidatus Gracilibacteria bacterium]|jgi:chromosomal replication initiator protein